MGSSTRCLPAPVMPPLVTKSISWVSIRPQAPCQALSTYGPDVYASPLKEDLLSPQIYRVKN